ncbi:MAG: hypothetical protein ACRD4W_06730, partial [Nitrososphaeraceae archaeon]
LPTAIQWIDLFRGRETCSNRYSFGRVWLNLVNFGLRSGTNVHIRTLFLGRANEQSEDGE